MKEKVIRTEWYPGGWQKRGYMGEVWFIPAGNYEIGALFYGDDVPKGTVKLSGREYYMLKEFIAHEDPNGIIHTDRSEDLKIIHKLMDILHKSVEA